MKPQGFNRLTPAVRGVRGELIELLEPLTYLDPHLRFSYTVPKGFLCDGASIQSIRRLFRATWLELLPDGIGHDYLYRTDAVIVAAGRDLPVPGRSFADQTMATGMRLRDSTRGDAWKVAWGLPLFGRWAFRKKAVGWKG